MSGWMNQPLCISRLVRAAILLTLPGSSFVDYATYESHIPYMSRSVNNSDDTSVDPDEPTTSRTRRLQNKIKSLQEQIQRAEIAASESSQRAGVWTNEILLGQRQIEQAPLEITVPYYQSSLQGALASNELDLPGSSGPPPYPVVYRRFLHNELGRWDRGLEIPAPLRHLLYVSS
jgi:hypothetical protein